MTEEYSSSNQARTEPIPPSPAHGEPGAAPMASPALGSASRVPGVEGTSPDAFEADTDEGASRVSSAVSEGSSAPSAQGVPVPSDVPAEGTSEGADPVDGVRVTAIAQEGLADGETDTRMPPTTTF